MRLGQLPALGTVQAVYAYEATTEEELTINDDDMLEALATDDPDWMLVRHTSGAGFVPTSYVQALTVSVSVGMLDYCWCDTADGGYIYVYCMGHCATAPVQRRKPQIPLRLRLQQSR